MKNNKYERKNSRVFIISARRTPIGCFDGALKDFSATDLGSVAIKEAVEKANMNFLLSPAYVGSKCQVFMGNVLSAGLGQNPARQAAIKAGLSKSIPCVTVGKVCGSGMQAVINAYQLIKSGDIEFAIAGGTESMTNAPYLVPRPLVKTKKGEWKKTTGNFSREKAVKMRENDEMSDDIITFLDSMLTDGLSDAYDCSHMGEIAAAIAEKHAITREEQDEYARVSNELAINATKTGLFKNEIIPINNVGEDEGMKQFNQEKMKTIKPVFGETITAANASKISDGAAALFLASEETVEDFELIPLAEIIDVSCFASDPDKFPEAPLYAINNLLIWHRLNVNDILWEINEAFALVPLIAMRSLGISRNNLNVHGGAVALGHPIGASGARILTTLVHAMENRCNLGIAAICIGGGEALAMLIKRL